MIHLAVHDPGSDPGSDAELQPNPISANYDALLGKRLHNYGKSPCLMGKSTINGSFFNSYVKLPEGKSQVRQKIVQRNSRWFPILKSEICQVAMICYDCPHPVGYPVLDLSL